MIRTPLGAPTEWIRSSPLAALGERLFVARLLSRDDSTACASCHVRSAGFSGDVPQAVALGGALTNRRAPPMFALAGAKALMWDGRATTLRAQVRLPLEGAEMAVDWTRALVTIGADPALREQFRRAGRPVTRATVIAALASYVGSLTASPSRFDRYYYGHEPGALTMQEVRGWRVFSRAARCDTCHLVGSASATFTDGGFHATGIGFSAAGYADVGRADVTGKPADVGAFKTPTLRNVALRPYLMHDGSMTSLRQVIDYYNKGGNRRATNLDARLEPLHLSAEQVDDLVAFLGTLTSDVVSVRGGQGAAEQFKATKISRFCGQIGAAKMSHSMRSRLASTTGLGY